MPSSYVVGGAEGGFLSKLSILACVLLGTLGALIFCTYYLPLKTLSVQEYWVRLGIIYIVTLFQPLLAYSYYFYRRKLRWSDVDRIQARLTTELSRSHENDRIRQQFEEYIQQYKEFSAGLYFIIAVGISWVVSAVGSRFGFCFPTFWLHPTYSR